MLPSRFNFADCLRPCYSSIGFSAVRQRDLHISHVVNNKSIPWLRNFIMISSPRFCLVFLYLGASLRYTQQEYTMFQFNALSQSGRRFALFSPSIFLLPGAIAAQSFNASTVDLNTRGELLFSKKRPFRNANKSKAMWC